MSRAGKPEEDAGGPDFGSQQLAVSVTLASTNRHRKRRKVIRNRSFKAHALAKEGTTPYNDNRCHTAIRDRLQSLPM